MSTIAIEGPGGSKKFSLLALLCCTTLTFALGWGAAQVRQHWQVGKAGQPQAASTAPGAGPTKADATADALSQFNAIDWNAQQPAGADKLVAALPGNAALRMAALQRYRQEPVGLAKFNLRQLLTAQALAEVVAAATSWAQQADDAAARADGFNLLQAMPPQPASYLLARQEIEHGKDPRALAGALGALVPVGIPDPVEVQRVVPRLHTLTQHPMADVRGVSIQRLADWDRARLHITQDVLRLMADPDTNVRIAAVGATSIAALTTDAVKARLFEILSNPKEDAELRSVVALQIDRFALNSKEYAVYQAVQNELFNKAKDK